MFTDRFIKVPTKIYHVANSELTGKRDYEDSWAKINPMDICTYGLTSDDELEIENIVRIDMKSGYHFTAYIDMEEFERLLNNHGK